MHQFCPLNLSRGAGVGGQPDAVPQSRRSEVDGVVSGDAPLAGEGSGRAQEIVTVPNPCQAE